LNITLSGLFEPLGGVSLAPTGERRANAATPPEIKRSRLRYAGVSCTRMGYYIAGRRWQYLASTTCGIRLEECHADLPVPLREVQ
jgi:hypothetical protein